MSENLIDETGLNAGTSTQVPEPIKESKDELEIKRLRQKGQDYLDNEDQWRFFLKSYEGGPNYIDETTLFKHPREASLDYTERMRRASVINYVQPLVDFVPEYIFSQDVERSAPADLKDEYEEFKKDCDLAGTALNAFMQSVGEDMRIFGMIYVQVDKPENPDEGKQISQARAKELGLTRPYVLLVRPLEVLDQRTDSKGNLIYLKRVEYTYLDTAKGFIDVERYTEWRVDSYKISVIDVSDPRKPKLVKAQGKKAVNVWGVIPFICAYYKRKKSNRSVGQSFLTDLAGQNRSVFNQTSLVDEFLYKQCFNVLAMPAKSGVPMREQTVGNIGTANVMEVPEDAKFLPSYVSPPIDPAEFIQKERANTVKEMYRQAAQDLMSEMTQGASGDAQRQQFSRTIPVINKTADALQYTEQRMMVLWARVQGKDWDGKISYKDDYSVTNLMDLLVNLGMIFNDVKVWSPTFIREEWKRIVREFDGQLDHPTLETIISEIDAMSDDELKERFAAPVKDRKSVTGVPSTANMVQGEKQTTLKTDARIGGATGSRAATKERLPDANRRTSGSRRN